MTYQCYNITQEVLDRFTRPRFYPEGASMYVSKFEKKLPTEEIAVVIAAARGQATRKEGISAGVYALGCGAEFLPDGGAPMMQSHVPASDEDCAVALESHLPAMSAAGDDPSKVGLAIPWTIVLPLVFQLLQRWLK